MDFPNIMEEFIDSRIGYLKEAFKDFQIKYFMGLGGELRIINIAKE